MLDPTCIDSFESFPNAIVFLFENALTGDNFFECAHRSKLPFTMWLVAFVYLTIAGLLLLNMLIAMSACRPPPAA